MATIFDIAPATESVTINGHAIPVYGISASSILMILKRCPELVDEYQGGEPDVIKMLVRHGGQALAATLAAAFGYPGKPEAEEVASKFPAETQIEVLSAAIRLTMPEGMTPFFKKLEGVLATFGLTASVQPQNETSLPASGLTPPYSNGHDPHHNGVTVQ